MPPAPEGGRDRPDHAHNAFGRRESLAAANAMQQAAHYISQSGARRLSSGASHKEIPPAAPTTETMQRHRGTTTPPADLIDLRSRARQCIQEVAGRLWSCSYG